MKKLLAVLLALCVIGGFAFAQAIGATASGGVTLIDEDLNSTFARNGSGYDVLSLKGTDKDGKWGFTANLDNFLNTYAAAALTYTDSNGNKKYDVGEPITGVTSPTTAFTGFRDWNAWFKTPYVKFIVGKIRNGDFRQTLPSGWIGNYAATSRFFGGVAYGLVVESTTLGSVTVGLGLPVPEAGATLVSTLENADIGFKYADKTLTAKAQIELGLDSSTNIVNLGAAYTGVENLNLVGLTKLTFASASSYAFALGGYYTMDKLNVGLELEGKYTTAFAYDACLDTSYAVNDAITADLRVMYYSTNTVDAFLAGTYDFGNGCDFYAQVGYDTTPDEGLYYGLTFEYSISF